MGLVTPRRLLPSNYRIGRNSSWSCVALVARSLVSSFSGTNRHSFTSFKVCRLDGLGMAYRRLLGIESNFSHRKITFLKHLSSKFAGFCANTAFDEDSHLFHGWMCPICFRFFLLNWMNCANFLCRNYPSLPGGRTSVRRHHDVSYRSSWFIHHKCTQ